MEYDKKIMLEAKRQLAIMGVEHLGKIDARTLTIFQKNGIFESMKPAINEEEILPILKDQKHTDRRPIGHGPLFCYLAKKEPPEANIVNMVSFFFATNVACRKAALDYFRNLDDEELPILTLKSRDILKTLGEPLISDDSPIWRDAAVAIHDTLEDDWYCNYAALKQCLARNFVSGVEEFLTKVIRPTISSVETITTGVWAASEQKEKIALCINQIVKECTEVIDALNKYFLKLGHLTLINELSISGLLTQWQQQYGRINNIWSVLWKWADSFGWPLQRYHVCMYFILHPEQIPEDKYPEFWQEIAEIVYMPKDEKDDLKWTQSWRMFSEVARHLCYHLENRLPYMEGERIASQSWWLAYHVCTLFSSNKEEVKQTRNETFLPELIISSNVHQVASPVIKPAALRFLTINTNSVFSLAIQSAIGKNLDSLKPQLINKKDFEKIEISINGSILMGYPAKLKEDSEKTYAFDDSVLMTAKKWMTYIDEKEQSREMISAFITGIEKLIKSDSISDLLNKVIDTNFGNQILIANYFRNIIFTEDATFDDIWEVINNRNWREVAFRKSHPLVFELIYESLNEIETRYQDKWAYNLPHFYALECEQSEDEDNKKRLFASVILSSICGNSVSGIQRLLKCDKKYEYQEKVDFWRKHLKQICKCSPEWVKNRIRPVLAVLHL